MKNFNHSQFNDVHTENMIIDLKKRLERKGYAVVILNDTSKLKNVIDNLIPDESRVGLDGSKILYDLNIHSILEDKWSVQVDPYRSDLPQKIKKYLFGKVTTTEFFIMSPLAVFEDGRLVIDKKNEFLMNRQDEKPENVIAFVGTEHFDHHSVLKSDESKTLEVSPYGLQRGEVDNYGQIEDWEDFTTGLPVKQSTFTIVIVTEELAY